MTQKEIVTALREHAERAVGNEWGTAILTLGDNLPAAADLIENQQRRIEALMQANAALRDTVLRRDAQIEKMSANLLEAKNTANQHAAINDTLYDSNAKLAADRKVLKNELCQYCGKYKQAHEGACDGCRWREM